MATEIKDQIGRTKHVFVWFDSNKHLQTMVVDRSLSSKLDKKIPGYVGLYDRFVKTAAIENDIIDSAVRLFGEAHDNDQ